MYKMTEKLTKYAETLTAAKEMGQEFMWQTLMETGEKMPPFPKEEMKEKNRVNECISTVYITADKEGGKVFYKAYSDTDLVRGMIFILVDSLSGKSSQEIKEEMPSQIEEFNSITQINKSLSSRRANAFSAIFEFMRNIA